MHVYNDITLYCYGQQSDLYRYYYYHHHIIWCALLPGRQNWQITEAATTTPNDVHTQRPRYMFYYIILCVCVCVCVQHLPRTNYFYLTSVIYIFFYSVICYAHYRSTVSLSFQCPTRTCIIIIIIIICTDSIARETYTETIFHFHHRFSAARWIRVGYSFFFFLMDGWWVL